MSFSEAINDMEEDNSDFPVLLDSGDLRLLVSHSNQRLTWLGSSSSLSLVSPVWNKILNPPFPKLVSQEGGDEDMQYKQIDFSEDSGEALLILLRIAHCQFNKLQSTLDYEIVVELAILCDKYDCVGLVKPWLALWLNGETEYRKPRLEDWLYIAWVFGKEYIFQTLAMRMLREMTTNDTREAMTSTGGILQCSVLPEIIENMMTIRQATIRDLLKVAYDYFDTFLRDDESVCCQRSSKRECDAIVCGSLVIGLNAFGLWPQKSSDDINISVQDPASKLKSLRVYKYPSMRGTGHYDCGLVGLDDKIDSVLSSIPDPVLESHRRHMRIQTMK